MPAVLRARTSRRPATCQAEAHRCFRPCMLECQNQTCQTLTRTIDSYLTQTGHPETPWAATSSKKTPGSKKLPYIYIYVMVDQNSFIRERPFFANKELSFANLSRTPGLSVAEPMLSNSSSSEDSFITC